MSIARIIRSLKQEKQTQERLAGTGGTHGQTSDYHRGYAAGLGVAISELAHKAAEQS